MKYTLHTAGSRGHVNFGWLDSHHSFSFGHYNNPERMHFGALRVLNDDIVTGGNGFDLHPHDNMEIISIPLYGSLEHTDSTGTKEVIRQNDVQIMSAGTGIRHSEYNHSPQEETNFLQIWIFPRERNIKPRYEQKAFVPADRSNRFQEVVAPDNDQAVWINQDAWLSLGNFEPLFHTDYVLKNAASGVYAFMLNGEAEIGGQVLHKRDAIGIWDTDRIPIRSLSDAEILLIEVPMQLS